MQNIFITGFWRSGTSLLLRLFDSHPQVFAMPSETGIITILEKDPEFLKVLKRCKDEHQLLSTISANGIMRFQDIVYGDLNGISFSKTGTFYPFEFDFEIFSQNFLACLKENNTVEKIVYGYYDAIRSAWKNCTFLSIKDDRKIYAVQRAHRIDKYPREDSVRFVADNVPDMVVIEMVRDPIFQIGSAMKNEKDLSLDQAIVSWSYSYNYIKKRSAKYPGRYILIKYEELTSNPESTMKKLADFIGIDFDGNLLIPTFNGNPWKGNSTFEKKDGLQASKKIFLNDEQLSSVKKSLGGFRDELGYANIL